jgi:ADP-ribosylation factor GTPase-activating protein 2/3
MACSGNQRARVFFKQHGWQDEGGMKLEGKYTSRAAEMYRQTLIKEVHTNPSLLLNGSALSARAVNSREEHAVWGWAWHHSQQRWW